MTDSGGIRCTQFWLRKLHSLTGFVFLGYFLCLHVRGEPAYTGFSSRALFLFLPLVFHGAYGLYITFESRPNPFRYGWVRNWMYFGQRATGVFLVPFLALHLGAVRWSLGYADSGWYRGVWYAGVLGAVFHLANGIFGTTIDWGVSVGPQSQRVMVGLSFLAFLLLSAYGLYTLYSS